MKKTLALTALILMLAAPARAEFVCNECHSKNPGLRAMHAALEYKNCGQCHPSRDQVKFTDAEKKNRNKDARCVRCHK